MEEEFKKTRMNNKIDSPTLYDKPEIVDFIVKERTNDKTFTDITTSLKEKGYPSITRGKVSELYNKGITRTVTVEKRGGKKFQDFSSELNDMYSRSVNIMQEYINVIQDLVGNLKDLGTSGSLDTIKVKKQIMSTIPVATNLFKELRGYMQFHQEQQDKITLNQKSVVWDTQTLMDNMHIAIGTLESEGYKIIKPEIV